jgi:two-component system cell cycle sensor histidine kinase/response regulator CckA
MHRPASLVVRPAAPWSVSLPSDSLPPAAILVVDDEESVSRLVTRLLTHQGYVVLQASSGEEALAVVRQRRPPVDLVLSDVVMPGMDGMELAGLVLAECPGPGVILMTGQLPQEIERVNVGGRIVRVLRKPLDLDQLLEVLRATLEHFLPDERSEPPMQAG